MSHDLAILSHHKCATNWLRGICSRLARAGLIEVEVTGGRDGPAGGAAESRLRVRLDVNATAASTAWFGERPGPVVHFVRDPRDALVSNYWSWLKSHENNSAQILDFRARAETMGVEEGMLALIPDFPMGRQLSTWPEPLWAAARTVRYEDLLADFGPTLRSIFAPGGLAIPDRVAAEVQEATAFARITGRQSGQEDVSHHFRKGVAGDWRTYFTPRIAAAFEERWGWLGPRLGYSEGGT